MSDSTWMSDLAEYIRNVPLMNLVLPGTHDSGTYAITINSPVSPDAPKFVQDVEAVFDNPFYYYWIHLLHADFDSVVSGWAKAQGKDITAQLKAGIRYLDCRVCRDGDTTRIAHGMYAEKTDTLIDAVSDFIAQNPNEVVVLDFNHFYDMTADAHEDLVEDIINTFGDAMAPNTVPPDVTMGELWGKNYQVVVIYHCGSDDTACLNATKNYPQLWLASAIWSPWPNVRDMDKLKSDLTHNLDKRLSDHPDQLFVLQGILTPDTGTIEDGLNPFRNYPRNLEEMADDVTPTVVDWVKNLWYDQPLNIIIVDWFERADLVGVAKALNRGFNNVIDWTAVCQPYDTGSLLAVAMDNNGNIVDVHCGSAGSDNAYNHYYKVGALNAAEYSIAWGKSHNYDTGTVLAVAVNDNGDVVEVHCGSPGDKQYNHYYHVGSLNAKEQTINWGDSHKYETGSIVAVALDNDGNVVQVHCGSPPKGNQYNHYYLVGALDAKEQTISWGESTSYDTGSVLAVAMNNNGAIVEIHCGTQGTDRQYVIYYRIGTLDAGAKTIEWGPSTPYAEGSLMAVAINDNGCVVDVHCGTPDDGRQNNHYYKVGALTTNAQGQQVIDWSQTYKYDTGSLLAVALDNDGNVVEIHCGSQSNGNNHYYDLGKLAVQQTRNTA